MKFRKLPPLNELAAFEATARHRSFTKASKELFLTPSAISQRLRQLEKRLDKQLLVRTRRSVQLTTDGARYLQAVSDALSKLVVASEDLATTGTKRVRLGIVPALASNWLIRELPEFYRRFPGIDLDIQAAITRPNIAVGEVDIAIRLGSGNWPGLEKFKLFPDEQLAVCSQGYLKQVRTLRSPADLLNAVLLRNARLPWKPWFEKAGLEWPEPARGPLFNDSTLALQAAVDGQGVALGRRILVKNLLKQGLLVQLYEVSAATEQAFFVVYRKESLKRTEVAAFIDWIKSVAAREHELRKHDASTCKPL